MKRFADNFTCVCSSHEVLFLQVLVISIYVKNIYQEMGSVKVY